MIKTVTLDGSEQMVECTGGRNMMVINKSDSPVYASRNQNVSPYEDEVMEIDAGSRDTVEGANGVVYLSGTGQVEVRGIDYVGFKKPSSSSGNGGGGDTPTAETMPYINGIIGIFTPETIDISTSIWGNVLLGGENIQLTNAEENGAAVRFRSNGYGQVRCTGTVNVIYIISKQSNVADTSSKDFALVGKNLTEMSNGTAFNIMIAKSIPHNYTLTSIASDSHTDVACDDGDYHCVCITRDPDTNTGSIYVEAQKKSVTSQVKEGTSNYAGSLCINNWKATSYTMWNGTNSPTTDCVFFAFGSLPHTNDQIKANSEWLMKKYLK